MEEGLVVRGRVEIDSRQPFKSVKEAVLLFGEKVLANEVYANKLKKIESLGRQVNNQVISQNALGEGIRESKKDEEKLMAYYLISLKQQLEETKSELNQLRSTREPHPSHYNDTDVEEIKFIQNAKPTQEKPHDKYKLDDNNNSTELEPYVTREFDVPSPTKVIVEVPKVQEKALNFRKAKKKTLIPSLGRMFSKSKG